MRWNTRRRPAGDIGDGETLWIYQPDERQVIKAKLGAAFQARTPITFLAGLGRLERDFVASLEREDADHWVLKLVPRDDTGIGTLTLTLKKPDAVIEEARITDPSHDPRVGARQRTPQRPLTPRSSASRRRPG